MRIKHRNAKVVFFSLFFFIRLSLLSGPGYAQEPAVRSRIVTAASDAVRITLRGNTHPLASARNDVGVAPDSLPMERMLLLTQRGADQEAALQKLIQDQQTKGSPAYHKWLTPRDFGIQFGPSDEDLGQITTWLSTQGFHVNRTAMGRTVIEFSGTAGQVRNAFHTEIHKYIVNGKEYWANSADPQIPAALAPAIQGIVSLHNIPTASQNRQAELATLMNNGIAGGGPTPEFTFQSSGCTTIGNCYGVAPADFATIYNVAPLWAAGIDGTGQTIAIASGSNIRLPDAQHFRQLFNLPQNDPVVFVDGTDPGIVPIEELFTNFGVQWTGAVAKNAKIELVVSQTTSTSRGTDLAAIYVIDNNLAPILTESLVACEDSLGASGTVFYTVLWEQAAAEGITVVIPTGDTGSAACDSPATEIAATHGIAVNGVASTPYNVAVGGTDFAQHGLWPQYWNSSNDPTTHASAKSYIPERVYNDTCTENGLNGCVTVNPSGSDLIAGGGGLSKYHQTPPWQKVGSQPLQGSRGLPDVSLFAGDGNDGSFYIMCEEDAQIGGPGCNLDPPYASFVNLGGTTGSASAFAGIMALVNQKTGGRQGNANFVLYPLAAVPAAGVFHDVTLGSISVACVAGTPYCSNTSSTGYGILGDSTISLWSAYPGYDLATGWGSVDANNLVTQWSSISFTPTTTTLMNFIPTTLVHGQAATFTITVMPNSGSATPTGDVALMVHPSPGVPPYAADVFTLQNGSITGSTTFLPGGSYQVTAHYAGDGTFGTSDSAAVSLNVTPQPSQTVLSVPTKDNMGNLTCQTQGLEVPYGTTIIYGIVNTSGIPCQGVNTSNPPTGTIQLTDNGAPLDAGTYTLNARAHFEDHAASLTPGNHNVVATYSGDSSYSSSTSVPLGILIDQAPTTSVLTANPLTVVSGTNVTLTVTINTKSVGGALTGRVSFRSNAGLLGQATVTSSLGPNGYLQGIAVFTFAPPNTVTVNAAYSGDSNYLGSSASPVTITSGTPDFTSASKPNPLVIAAGQTGTVTITISPLLGYTGTVALACPPSPPPGVTCAISPSTVTLSSNGNPVTAAVTIQTLGPSKIPGMSANNFPAAKFVLYPATSAGIVFAAVVLGLGWRRRFKAMFTLTTFGFLFFTGSCAQVAKNSGSSSTSLTLTTSSVKAAQGTPVTLSAAISANHTVNGTVDFLDGTASLAAGVPVSFGRALTTTSTLTVGTHSITATYSGDASTNSATTVAPLLQVITGDFRLQVSATSGTLSHSTNVDVTLQ